MIGLGPTKERCTGERPLSSSARPWCDVPASASNANQAPRVSRGASAPVLAISKKEAQHSGLLRARYAALAMIGLGPAKGRCANERPLSSSARPWCDVLIAASNARPAPAPAVSREEAQHSSLLRARAILRWLWPASTPQKDAED